MAAGAGIQEYIKSTYISNRLNCKQAHNYLLSSSVTRCMEQVVSALHALYAPSDPDTRKHLWRIEDLGLGSGRFFCLCAGDDVGCHFCHQYDCGYACHGLADVNFPLMTLLNKDARREKRTPSVFGEASAMLQHFFNLAFGVGSPCTSH